MKYRCLLPALALALLAVVVLLPSTPMYRHIPTRDAGVFLYIGQQILNGHAPYQDIWDHKPPAVYYIAAIGLLVGGGSIWGVWLIEFVSLYAALLLAYTLLRRELGFSAALFGLAILGSGLAMLLAGENAITEEFGLPFQFAALYALTQLEQRRAFVRNSLLLGVVTAVLFLLRPNLVGVSCAILLYLMIRIGFQKRKDLRPALLFAGVGATGVLLLTVLYFVWQSAFADLLDQVFYYNAVYSAATFAQRVSAIAAGVGLFSITALIALLGWCMALFGLIKPGGMGFHSSPLLLIAVIGLPVEFALASVSGRTYAHYYITWLPIYTILAGVCMLFLTSLLANRRVRNVPLLISAVTLPLVLFTPALIFVHRLTPTCSVERADCQAMAYINAHTDPDDTVLIWGAETSINFVTGRAAPTRFVYQYPLYTRRYQNAQMIDEFLSAIRQGQPVLVVDTSSTNHLIPPLDSTARAHWSSNDHGYGVLPEMEAVFDYLSNHYRPVAELHQGWVVYALVER